MPSSEKLSHLWSIWRICELFDLLDWKLFELRIMCSLSLKLHCVRYSHRRLLRLHLWLRPHLHRLQSVQSELRYL